MKKTITIVLAVIGIISLMIAGFALEPAALAKEGEVKKDAIEWVGQAQMSAEYPNFAVMQRICDKITAASKGRLKLTVEPPDAVCPAGEEFNAVNGSVIDFAFSNPRMWGEQFFPASELFDTRGGGMSPMEKHLWFISGGGAELAQEMIDDYNVHIIPSGAYLLLTPELFLHSNTKIDEPSDLIDLNIRAVPDGLQILNNMGANATYLPSSEVCGAMESGEIDACEFSSPWGNWDLGLQEVADYVYASGIRQSHHGFYFIVNQTLWNELPDDLKVIVQEVSEKEAIIGFDELCQLDIEALANFRDYPCAVETLSPEIEEAFIKEAKAYHDEVAETDSFYAEVLRSLRAFEAIQRYAELCE